MTFPKEPTIVNITGTVLLKGPMPLELYSEFLPCTEYIPNKFAALKLCCPEPFITSLIFRCGKIVCVGSTSPQILVDSVRWIIKQINVFEDGDGYSVPKINIENLVACSNLDTDLCLRKIQTDCPYFVHYEPEIFPGLSISLETKHGTITSQNYRRECKKRYRAVLNTYKSENLMPADVLSTFKSLEKEILEFKTAKLKHKSIKLVIFQTGKVNIVGCKSFTDIQEAYQFLIHLHTQKYFQSI